MAEKVGAAVGYQYCEIKLSWPNEGAQFALPLEGIEKIYSTLGQKFKPQAFIAALNTPSSEGYSPDYIYSINLPVTVFDDGGMKAALYLNSSCFPAPWGEDRWQPCIIKDGYLKGKVRTNAEFY